MEWVFMSYIEANLTLSKQYNNKEIMQKSYSFMTYQTF